MPAREGKGAVELQEGGSGENIWSRRNLLGVTGWLWILGALTAGFAAMVRMSFPRVLFEPPTRFKAGMPSDYLVNQVSEKWVPSQRVWVVREPWGFYAILAICTHLGCTPRWLEAEHKFKCPCHGSGYYGPKPSKKGPDMQTAVNFEGPAPRPMDRVHITLADDGQLLIDKSITYRQELDEWGKPGAYLNYASQTAPVA